MWCVCRFTGLGKKCYKTEWQLRCSSISDASWGSRFLMARYLQTSHDQTSGFWGCRNARACWAFPLLGVKACMYTKGTSTCRANILEDGVISRGGSASAVVLAPVPCSWLSCPAQDGVEATSSFSVHQIPSVQPLLNIPSPPWPHALPLPKTHSWLSKSSLLSTKHGQGPASNWNVVQQQLWALLLPPPSTSHSPSTVQAKFVHLFLLDFGFNKSYKIILFGLFQYVDTSSCPFAASVCTPLALAWAAVGS